MKEKLAYFALGCVVAGAIGAALHYRELTLAPPPETIDWQDVWAKVDQKATEKAEAKAAEHAATAKSEAIAESGKRIDEVLGLARSHGAIIDKLEQSIDDNVAMLREKWGNDLKTLNGRITELARPAPTQQAAQQSTGPQPTRQAVPVAPPVRVSPPSVQVQQSSGGGGGFVDRQPIIVSQNNNQQVIQQQNPVTIREERRPPQDFFAPARSYAPPRSSYNRPDPPQRQEAEPDPPQERPRIIPEPVREEVKQAVQERVEEVVEQAAPQAREKLGEALDGLRDRLKRD